MNLKELSNSSTQLDGAVTYWMMPFRTVQCDPVIGDLEQIEPKFEYVHAETGECTHDEPAEYARDVLRAKATNTPFASRWSRRFLWTDIHTAFWQCEVLTTAIDFAEGEQAADVRAFTYYWQHRPADTAERWVLYKNVIGVRVWQAWLAAFNATRDTSMAAPAALQGVATTDEEKKDGKPPKKRSSAK